jgi:hypothetical protein
MRHDVERGPLTIEPARKSATPLLVSAANVQLYERAGILLRLPWRGALARAQPHDHAFGKPHRLSRPQRQIAAFAVPLVEQPQHRHALGHRRRARNQRLGIAFQRHHFGLVGASRRYRIGQIDHRRRRRSLLPVFLPDRISQPAADGDQGRQRRAAADQGMAPVHASGDQAS